MAHMIKSASGAGAWTRPAPDARRQPAKEIRPPTANRGTMADTCSPTVERSRQCVPEPASRRAMRGTETRSRTSVVEKARLWACTVPCPASRVSVAAAPTAARASAMASAANDAKPAPRWSMANSLAISRACESPLQPPRGSPLLGAVSGSKVARDSAVSPSVATAAFGPGGLELAPLAPSGDGGLSPARQETTRFGARPSPTRYRLCGVQLPQSPTGS